MTKNNRHILTLIGSIFVLLIYCCGTPENETSKEWVYVGLESKLINDWAISENYLYVSAIELGLWKIDLNNTNYECKYLGFAKNDSNSLNQSGIRDILLIDDNPEEILVTVNYEYTDTAHSYLFKSTNGGDTWNAVDSSLATQSNGQETKKRLYLLEQNSVKIIGAGIISGVFESVDEGDSWQLLNSNIEIDGSALISHPLNSEIIWFGGKSNIFTPKLAFSNDGGMTWNYVTSNPSFNTDNKVVFIGLTQNLSEVIIYLYGELIKSLNYGMDWDTLSLNQFDLIVYDKFTYTDYFASSSDTLYRSNNMGVDWHVLEDGVDASIYSLFFDSYSKRLFISTDHGIFFKIMN